MTHHIYHTRGLILMSSLSGESNRFYKIFTEELGLVGAHAQAVREGKSKLRYILQDHSFVNVDLVRGKEMWRIVSAGADRTIESIKKDPTRTKLFAEFCALLARLLQGEGCDRELFEEAERVVTFLEKERIKPELILSFETLYTLRVLVHLGYLNSEGYDDFLVADPYKSEILQGFEKIRLTVLPQINEAFNASHL
ncbi:MAG: recombination protein O N-terminal domain-containing protein [bacterium]|nr:recombination protein O N-terminal domain-containing protein [bacterium]